MAAPMSLGGRGTGEHVRRSTVHTPAVDSRKKKVSASAAWREARGLVWAHRRRLGLGLVLMLVSRLAGLVLPASSKWLIDQVAGEGGADLRLRVGARGGA